MCNKCCICLEDLKEKGKVILDCGHSIHMACFMELLKHDTIFCPMCRGTIKDNINYYNFMNLRLSIIMRNIKRINIISKEININETEIAIDLS